MRLGALLGAGLAVGVALAGCAADEPSSLAGRDAHARLEAALSGYELAVFVGLAATDAQVTLSTPGPWASVVEHFGAGAADGRPGDGRAASWISTHFVWDRESDRAGGLFTKVTSEGTQRLFVPFPGPYRGAPAALEASGRALLPMPALHANPPGDEGVLCGLDTATEAWVVDSTQAMSIAMRDPVMQAHRATHPSGEFTYFYLPSLVVEAGCGGNLTDPGNHWTIQHTDLRAPQDAGIVEIRVDAATGTAGPATLRPLESAPPLSLRGTLEANDGAVVTPLEWHSLSVALEVPEGGRHLYLQTLRESSPRGLVEQRLALFRPDGSLAAQRPYETPLQQVFDPNPPGGTWILEITYRTAEPLGRHAIEWFARID